jgi:hypothetical protein
MGSLSEFIQSPILSRLSLAMIVIPTMGGFFWLRAGSIQSILERIWRLMAGKTDVCDKTLNSFIQKNRDLERFRFLYRIKVETFVDMQKLIAWVNDNNISMIRLQKMRSWIDAKDEKIVLAPPKNYSRDKKIVTSLALIVFFCASLLGSSPVAYFKMKVSGKWFETDAVTVKSLGDGLWFVNSWSFNLSDCKDEQRIVQLTKFHDAETDTICKALKGGELKSLTKETIKFQRWFAATFALVTSVIALLCSLAAYAAREAENLRENLYGSNIAVATRGKKVVKPKTKRQPRNNASPVQPAAAPQQTVVQRNEPAAVVADEV